MGWNVSGFSYTGDPASPSGRRVRIESAGPDCDGYVINAPNGHICKLDRGGPLALTDARLIAAAPDLYAALEEIRRLVTAYRAPNGLINSEGVLEIAVAAIAKADGAA